MIPSRHRFGALGASILLSAAHLGPLAVPSAGQGRDTDAPYAVLMFLQSVASQRTARTCERGVPGYRRRFDNLYKQWFAKHRARIERGESILKEALKRKDQQDIDRATLEQIEKAVAELAQPPRDTGPLTLDDGAKATCDEIILELERGLKP